MQSFQGRSHRQWHAPSKWHCPDSTRAAAECCQRNCTPCLEHRCSKESQVACFGWWTGDLRLSSWTLDFPSKQGEIPELLAGSVLVCRGSGIDSPVKAELSTCPNMRSGDSLDLVPP